MSVNLVIPIWKPVNWTSFDVVKKIRNILKIKKVGHAGTLDPFAEGILIVCTGNKTSHVEKFMNLEKEYEGIIKLGCRTPTLDPESEINEFKDFKPIPLKTLNEIKNNFIGTIDQIPPQYSAIKYKGKPIYKYARCNIRIDLPSRKVNIYEFDIQKFVDDKIYFKITCGRGTYIRAIARDIGLRLGTYGYLLELKRNRIGEYNTDKAIKINNIDKWLYTKI